MVVDTPSIACVGLSAAKKQVLPFCRLCISISTLAAVVNDEFGPVGVPIQRQANTKSRSPPDAAPTLSFSKLRNPLLGANTNPPLQLRAGIAPIPSSALHLLTYSASVSALAVA